MDRPRRALTALSIGLVTACTPSARDETPGIAPADSSWQRLSVDSLPRYSMGVSIRRGLALLAFTHDSMPEYAPSALKCTSCHLDN